jgi:hypothetical protein
MIPAIRAASNANASPAAPPKAVAPRFPDRHHHESTHDYLVRILRDGAFWNMEDSAIIGRTRCSGSALGRARDQVAIEPGVRMPGHPGYRPQGAEQKNEHIRRVRDQLKQAREALAGARVEAHVLAVRVAALERMEEDAIYERPERNQPLLAGLEDGRGESEGTDDEGRRRPLLARLGDGGGGRDAG